MTAGRLLVLVLLAGSLLAGCTAQESPGCTPTATSPGGQSVCFLTDDGWVIQGVEWSSNATDAPTVLLVHGLNEHHGSYDELALELANRSYHVLAIDSRGHGESTDHVDRGHRPVDQFTRAELQSITRDLEAAQEHMGSPPTVVVGASIGANEALVYAAEHPEDVDATVLLSPLIGRGRLATPGPNEAYPGAVLYMASEEDRRSASAARHLYGNHTGPDQLVLWREKGHGTQMLDAEGQATVLDWIADHAPPPKLGTGEPPEGNRSSGSNGSVTPR